MRCWQTSKTGESYLVVYFLHFVGVRRWWNVDHFSDCDTGYKKNYETGECEDLDECATVDVTCNIDTQVCYNTLGSYKCLDILQAAPKCQDGFRLNMKTDQCDGEAEWKNAVRDVISSSLYIQTSTSAWSRTTIVRRQIYVWIHVVVSRVKRKCPKNVYRDSPTTNIQKRAKTSMSVKRNDRVHRERNVWIHPEDLIVHNGNQPIRSKIKIEISMVLKIKLFYFSVLKEWFPIRWQLGQRKIRAPLDLSRISIGVLVRVFNVYS